MLRHFSLPLATSVIALLISPIPVGTVPLGTINCDGGMESTTLDPSAFTGGGGPNDKVSATVANKLPQGLIMDDLTVAIKGGSSGGQPTANHLTVGSVSVNMTSAPGGGMTGNVSGLGLSGNQDVAASVDGIDTHGATTLIVQFTPSTSVSISGVQVETNIVDSFHFTQTSDFARHGIGTQYHAASVVFVHNDDPQSSITQFDGTALFSQGSNAELTAVHLLDPSSGFAPVSGATSSISGDTFTINGFTLTSGGKYLLVLRCSRSLDGERFQCEVTSVY